MSRSLCLLASTLVLNIRAGEAFPTLSPPCAGDSDCEIGEFCNFKENFRFCDRGVDCSDLNRLDPRSGGVPRTKDACGDCLPGEKIVWRFKIRGTT